MKWKDLNKKNKEIIMLNKKNKIKFNFKYKFWKKCPI